MNSLDALPTLHRELYKLLLSTVSDRVQLPAYEHCLETNAQVERAPGAYRVPARISHSMCVVVLSGYSEAKTFPLLHVRATVHTGAAGADRVSLQQQQQQQLRWWP